MTDIDPRLEKIKAQLKVRLDKAKKIGASPLSSLAPDLIQKFKNLGLSPRSKKKKKNN